MSTRLAKANLARLKHIARTFATRTGDEQIDALKELADILARPAISLDHPAKSLTKRVPYYLSEVLSPGQIQAVIEMGIERVEELRDEHSATKVELHPLLTLKDVAPLLGLTSPVAERLLVDLEFRRECGWPQWIRGQWFFHPDAFGIRKPEYFSHLPSFEPYPAPPHCTPGPDKDVA